MRQIAGALRDDQLELSADPSVDLVLTPEISLAVLHHTASALTADALLANYLRDGLPAITERTDDCAVVMFDRRSRTLVLARDDLGTTPLYHATNGGGFAFGTRITDVIRQLKLDVQPNRVALAALLVYHEAAGPGETYFDDVASVPPGATLVRRGIELSVIPAPARFSSVQDWTYDDAVAEFRQRLEQSVARQSDASGPTAVLVSGGLDSSALLCLSARHGDAFGITYGPRDDAAADESRYLDVLRRTGLHIERVAFDPIIDVASAERSVLRSEVPVADMVPLTLDRAAAHAAQQGAHVLLSGTWGDQVLSPFPPPHHGSLTPWRISRLAHAYHQYMSDVPVAQIARALRRQGLRKRAPEWLLQRRRERRRQRSNFDLLAQSVAIFGPIDRIASYRDAVARGAFAPAQLQGIETNTKWGASHHLDARLPFLDRDLLHFLRTLPDGVAYHGYALKPLLRDAMRGIVPSAILDRRDKGDYTAAIRKHSMPAATVLEHLDGLRRPVQLGLMSRHNARDTLARLGRHTNIADGRDELAVLFGLDVWLRLFFEK